MSNPFAEIYERLHNIEGLLLNLDGRLENTTPLDPSTGKRYMSAAEAAAFMGIKLQTLYQNIDKVPHVKKFGKLAFVESDLVAHMETGRSASTIRKGTTNA